MKLVNKLILLILLTSCKSYKEFVLENSCGEKKIYWSKDKPFKVNNKSTKFILNFESGFKNDRVQIVQNDSIIMDKIFSSDFSTSYAGSYVFNEFMDSKIKIRINDDCFFLSLDENYTYYEIHNSKNKFNINLLHFPSIGE